MKGFIEVTTLPLCDKLLINIKDINYVERNSIGYAQGVEVQCGESYEEIMNKIKLAQEE